MRIFAFGCSLSQYFYPTWADVAIYEYKQKGYHGENWSRSGAGNQYIFTRLWEANTVHKFNKGLIGKMFGIYLFIVACRLFYEYFTF